jgi:hypothetical protein
VPQSRHVAAAPRTHISLANRECSPDADRAAGGPAVDGDAAAAAAGRRCGAAAHGDAHGGRQPVGALLSNAHVGDDHLQLGLPSACARRCTWLRSSRTSRLGCLVQTHLATMCAQKQKAPSAQGQCTTPAFKRGKAAGGWPSCSSDLHHGRRCTTL